MRDLLADIVPWLQDGETFVLATVIGVDGRAPRDVGAAMAVNARGQVAGSVSGGCIEPALVEHARELLESQEPRLLSFGMSNEEAWGVGLACGGTIHLLVEPVAGGEKDASEASVRTLLLQLAEAVAQGKPVALVQVVDGLPHRGGVQLLVDQEGQVRGRLTDPQLTEDLVREAKRLLEDGESARLQTGGVDVFIHAFAPPPTLHIIGAVHPARALAAAGRFLGYRVVVCDPRSPFATPERIPEAHEIVRRWPDEHLAAAALSRRDAVCVLTHDLKFDVPAIEAALATPVGYIGVMGSRRTQERRLASLREKGIPEAQLARLCAPIGLDIGARTPAEMAIAVMAEIIAYRRGRRPAVPLAPV